MHRKLAKILYTLYLHPLFPFLNILHTQFVKTKKSTLVFHSLNHVSHYSNESAVGIRWPKYWNFSFCTSPSNEYSGLISFRSDWLGLLAVQGTLKSLLPCHSSNASILWCSAFFLSQGNLVLVKISFAAWNFERFLWEMCRYTYAETKHCW